MPKSFKFISPVILIALTLVVSVLLSNPLAFAWTEPSISPPGGNASPPINVSGITQTKTGTLQVPMIADPITPTYFISPGGPVSATFYGKVGIGNPAPSVMLDVNGQIKISGGTPGAGKVLTSDATGLASWQNAASGLPGGVSGDTLRHDGINWIANDLLYNDGTNIGIGTTSPASKLHVYGVSTVDNNADNITIEGISNVADNNPAFVTNRAREGGNAVQSGDTLWEAAARGWDGDSYEPAAYIRMETDAVIGPNNIPGRILFKTTPAGGVSTARMIIKNDGNVGIGTTSPAAKVEISDGLLNTNTERLLSVHGDATTLGGGTTLHTAAFYNNNGHGLALGARDNDTYGSIQSNLFVNGVGTGAEKLILNEAGGAVGIGTASAAKKLHIAGYSNSSDEGSIILQQTDNAAEPSFSFRRARALDPTGADGDPTNDFNPINVVNGDSTGRVEFFGYKGGYGSRPAASIDTEIESMVTDVRSALVFNTNSGAAMAERMRIDQDGNVGIGTNDPGQRLEVNGAMRLSPSSTPTTTSNGVIYYDSTSNKFKCYQNGAWTDCIGSGSGGSVPSGTANNQTLYWDGSAWTLNNVLLSDGTHVGINSGGFGSNQESLDVHSLPGGYGAASIGDGSVSAFGLNAVGLGEGGNAHGITSFKVGGPMTVNGDYSVGINLDNAVRTMNLDNAMSVMGGNVGIGSVNPPEKLSVSGKFSITDDPNNNYTTFWKDGRAGMEGITRMQSTSGAATADSNAYTILSIDAPYNKTVQEATLGLVTDDQIMDLFNMTYAGATRWGMVYINGTSDPLKWRDFYIGSQNGYGGAVNQYLTIKTKDPASVDNGFVGIGTESPEFRLSINNDGGIIAKGTYGSGATLTTAGAGARMIWYPRKAAFRAGRVSGTEWDNANIGNDSFAFGYNAFASGSGALAIGEGTRAVGPFATAMGFYSESTGWVSTAIGESTTADMDYAFAQGINAHSAGVASTAMGYAVTSNGDYSFALGSGVNSATPLVNNTSNSFMVGFNSNIPTLFVGTSAGAGTTGKVGIGTSAPADKLTISSSLAGADNSSIMISNTHNTADGQGGKARLRFVTDAGEFLISRTTNLYPAWPGSGGDAVFNLCSPDANSNGQCDESSLDKYRFVATNSAGNSGDRMLITGEGDVSISTQGKGLIMRSPNGSCHRLTVSDAGAVSSVAATCPED